MAKISQEKKLEALKDWLRENKIKFRENYECSHGIKFDVVIPRFRIAIFLSTGEKEWESEKYYYADGGWMFRYFYKPFFVRPAETKKFVLEKIQNCCLERMMEFQKKYLREMEKQEKEEKK